MSGIIASFVGTLLVPVAIILAIASLKRVALGKPWPARKQLVADLASSTVITVMITLAITLVLRGTGYFESQYFHPSRHDFGFKQELGDVLEEVTFKSQDGTPLAGWFIPASGTALGTVVHLHGSGRNVTFTARHCAWLREQGFNVLAFDYRGYGKSEGMSSREGVIEDATAAIAYVRSRGDVDAGRICLWGQSMGGQVAIVAAEREQPNAIRAVVAEATYGTYSHHIKDKLAQLGPLWLVQWAAWLVSSDQYCAEYVVGRLAPTPLLLVHGTEDRGVRPYHSERLLRLAGEPKEIWRVEGGRHLDLFQQEANRAKLVEFFSRVCAAPVR